MSLIPRLGHGAALLAVRPRRPDEGLVFLVGWKVARRESNACGFQVLQIQEFGKQDLCLLNVETRVSELRCGGGWSSADVVVATAGLSVQGLVSPGPWVVLPSAPPPGDRGGPAGLSCWAFGFNSLGRCSPAAVAAPVRGGGGGDTMRC